MSFIGLLENITEDTGVILNEDLIASAAREGKLIASELEGYLKMMMKDSKIADQLTKSGIRNTDELLAALKGNRLSGTLKGSLELSILKSNTKNAKLIDLASENLVRNKMFNQKYAAEFAKGQPAYERALKQVGYSEDAITKIVQKKFSQIDPKTGKPYARPETIKAKDGTSTRTPAGGTTTTSTQRTAPVTPKQKQSFLSKINIFKGFKDWKTAVKYAAGIGIGAAALWALYQTYKLTTEDMPTTPPTETQWSPCIQNLLNTKEGQLGKSTGSGEISVVVKNTQYPGGIQFYSNGRVFDVTSKKLGTWRCKDGKTTLQEQVDNEMSNDVETMIDLLDFPVTQNNLVSAGTILKKYVDNGKGKEFLSLYQQSGLGGGDLSKTLNNVVTTQAKSVQAKNYLRQLINQISGGVTTQTKTGSGLDNIEITWDSKGSSKTGGKSKRRTQYRNCSGTPLPHAFGCRSEEVKQVQICLGLPEKYQTGNFGPITKNAIEKLNIDLSNGLTQNVIDKICNKSTDDSIGTVSNKSSLKLTDVSPRTLTGNEKPSATIPEMTPSEFYNRLRDTGNIIGEDGNKRIKYKGPELNDDQIGKLDSVLTNLGYVRIKQLEGEKRYGSKYVWEKQ